MKSVTAPVAAALVLAAGAYAQSTLTISTPANPVVCQPLLISWSGGTPPYFVNIHPGATPNDAAILSFDQTDSTSLTWKVNQASGTSLDLTIRDSVGQTQQSAPFTIQSGSDTSCVGQDPSGTTTGGASTTSSETTGVTTTTSVTGVSTTTSTSVSTTATTSVATSVTTPVTSAPTGSSTRASSSGTGSSSRTSASSASATPSNAASQNAVSFGAAGVVGALMAILA